MADYREDKHLPKGQKFAARIDPAIGGSKGGWLS